MITNLPEFCYTAASVSSGSKCDINATEDKKLRYCISFNTELRYVVPA
jgi:hypothetical protein